MTFKEFAEYQIIPNCIINVKIDFRVRRKRNFFNKKNVRKSIL